jgi:phosphocarrier protein HPr
VIKQRIKIINKLGLHARAAAKLVHLASRYASVIKLARNNKIADGKSIMGVMMLAATKETEIELSIEGEDEAEAMVALCDLISSRFGESE